ncbi:hypothetical protein GCM10009860_00280 [Microbacterium mitrae]
MRLAAARTRLVVKHLDPVGVHAHAEKAEYTCDLAHHLRTHTERIVLNAHQRAAIERFEVALDGGTTDLEKRQRA